MELFIKSCVDGNLILVKKYFICKYLNTAFAISCCHNQLEIVKWLVTKDVDQELLNTSFGFSCDNDTIKIAQFLLTTGVNHRDDKDYCFHQSVLNEELEASQWLFFLDTIHHDTCPDELLLKVTKVNVFETTKISLIEMYTLLVIS